MKTSEQQIITYSIGDIPDPADSRFKKAAPNGVLPAIFAGSENILHQISHTPPESVTAELLFWFDPDCGGHDRQSRLSLYFRIWVANKESAKHMALLVERGELSHFYKFGRLDRPLSLPCSLAASCDILRRQDFTEPLFGRGQNANIPDKYYTIRPFIPNDKNNPLALDRILDQVSEPTVISVRIGSTDTRIERNAMTAWIDHLHTINHGMDWRNDDFSCMDYFADGNQSLPIRHSKPGLLRRNDLLADDIRRSLRDIHEPLCQKSHLFFSIRVMATSCAVAELVASVFAGSAFKEGDYRLITSKRGCPLFDQTAETGISGKIQPFPTYEYVWPENHHREFRNLARLAQLAPVDEITGAFRLPVGSPFTPFCIRKNTDPPYESSQDMVTIGFDDQGIEGNPNPRPIGISCQALQTHLGIFGLPGKGKTTNNINMLFQFYEKKIPFLVIETAKTEYRVIKKHKKHKNKCFRELAQNLEVYNAAVEDCSPLRFNPLEILPGIASDPHSDNLMECFDAVMAMPPYVRSILKQALLDVYYANPDEPPTIMDLYATAAKVLSEKSYCGEVHSNIKGALETRIGDLTRGTVGSLFASPRSNPSVAHLMKSHTVIELDAVTKELKCALTLFILTAIREYLGTLPPADGLRFVILIEECHNVFGRGGDAQPSEEAADPAAYVAAFISRMLAELRALGVAVILSDQFPSQIDPMAMKCTSTKLAFRQVHGEDREDLAESMLLTDLETEDLARLTAGEAFFFRDGYFRPLRMKTTNLHEQLNLTCWPTNEELRRIIRDEEWYRDARRSRLSEEFGQLNAHVDDFADNKIRIMQQVKKLQSCYASLATRNMLPSDVKRLTVIRSEARKLRNTLKSAREAFYKGPYKLYGPALATETFDGPELKIWAESISERIDTRVEEGTLAVLERMNRLTTVCNTIIVKGTGHGANE
ncbi:MAG: ATP-binding protein [Planctomycetota bacterium]